MSTIHPIVPQYNYFGETTQNTAEQKQGDNPYDHLDVSLFGKPIFSKDSRAPKGLPRSLTDAEAGKLRGSQLASIYQSYSPENYAISNNGLRALLMGSAVALMLRYTNKILIKPFENSELPQAKSLTNAENLQLLRLIFRNRLWALLITAIPLLAWAFEIVVGGLKKLDSESTFIPPDDPAQQTKPSTPPQ
jgi:hypothetical protein